MSLGKKIKELRRNRKISLTELSEKSGVQIATLSRIENGKMTGTLQSHMQIAKAFGVDITELYKELSSPPPKDRAPQAAPQVLETFAYNETASYEILTSSILNKKMMPILLRIEPNGKTNPEQNSAGSEKFIFVLEGQMEVHIAENRYPLSPGKTLYFDASLKHFLANTGKTVARAVIVGAPVAL